MFQYMVPAMCPESSEDEEEEEDTSNSNPLCDFADGVGGFFDEMKDIFYTALMWGGITAGIGLVGWVIKARYNNSKRIDRRKKQKPGTELKKRTKGLFNADGTAKKSTNPTGDKSVGTWQKMKQKLGIKETGKKKTGGGGGPKKRRGRKR